LEGAARTVGRSGSERRASAHQVSGIDAFLPGVVAGESEKTCRHAPEGDGLGFVEAALPDKPNPLGRVHRGDSTDARNNIAKDNALCRKIPDEIVLIGGAGEWLDVFGLAAEHDGW